MGAAKFEFLKEDSKDPIDVYLKSIYNIPQLAKGEDRKLARIYRTTGDREAYDKLVNGNLRFAISVAKGYQNRGLPLLKLIAAANDGLMRAAEKYDPDNGVNFISYAVHWIRQKVRTEILNHSRTVRIPIQRYTDLRRLDELAKILMDDKGLTEKEARSTAREAMREEGINIDEALSAAASPIVSIDALMDRDGKRSLLDTLADESSQADYATERMEKEKMSEVLEKHLPPREYKIVSLYFGVNGEREHTLEEIGSVMGVTRERIRQLRDRGLSRLRKAPEMRSLLATLY